MKYAVLLCVLSPLACSGSIEGLTSPGDNPGPAGGQGGGSLGRGGTGGTGTGVGGSGTGGSSGAGGPSADTCRNTNGVGTPLRRLTLTEYQNTVRQLLGASVTFGTDIPDDAAAVGYDGDVATQGSSSLLAVGHFKSAEALAAAANITTLLNCGTAAEDACVHSFIERFGKRAYRRPLTPTEVTDLDTFYRTAKAGQGFDLAARMVLQLFLTSPNFLFRVEKSVAVGVIEKLPPYELATRLSYFFWGSMPDEMLFAAADADQLKTKEQVAAQAERMLADPRARTRVRYFASQWLGLGRIDEVSRNATTYKGWLGTLPGMMETQAGTAFEKMLFDEKATYQQLLTAPFTYVNPALATYLGLTAPTGTGFSKVSVDTNRYAGILTLPGPLAINSTEDASHPVYRGHWVQDNLLCFAVPPPPANLNITIPEPMPGMTTRQLYARHSSDPACAGCHSYLDAVGFGFENFDATGKWRTTEQGKPIDASGNLLGAGDVDGAFVGAAQLAQKLGNSSVAQECLARQMFRFSRGRHEAEGDACVISGLQKSMSASGGNLRALLVAMTQTDDFLSKTGTPAGGQ